MPKTVFGMFFFFRFFRDSTALWILGIVQGCSTALPQKNQKCIFFRDSTALSASKAWILGTVQHFLHADAQKCCTVPKKPKIPCQKEVCVLKTVSGMVF